MAQPSKWLIVSYYAGVDSLAASQHLDHRLPLFVQRGIEPIVLSSPCGARYTGFSHLRIPSAAPSGLRHEWRHVLSRTLVSPGGRRLLQGLLLSAVWPFHVIEQVLLGFDARWSWWLAAAPVAIRLARRNQPRVIYSTGGPISAHVAARLAAQATGIAHVAEFQDPIPFQYPRRGWRTWESTWAVREEHRLLSKAALAVFVTEAAANAARNRCPAARIVSIYPGARPNRSSSPYVPGAHFTALHVGSLSSDRDAQYLLEALQELLDRRSDLADRVRVHFLGRLSPEAKAQIARFPKPNTVIYEGRMPHEAALRRMTEADLLLLIQHRSAVSSETIPSKVYEYLQTGRPILGLVYRNPELRRLLAESGHAVAEADSISEIAAQLEYAFDRWERGPPIMSSPSPWTVDRAVDELLRHVGEALRAGVVFSQDAAPL